MWLWNRLAGLVPNCPACTGVRPSHGGSECLSPTQSWGNSAVSAEWQLGRTVCRSRIISGDFCQLLGTLPHIWVLTLHHQVRKERVADLSLQHCVPAGAESRQESSHRPATGINHPALLVCPFRTGCGSTACCVFQSGVPQNIGYIISISSL